LGNATFEYCKNILNKGKGMEKQLVEVTGKIHASKISEENLNCGVAMN
jgi:hypothetical protein